MHTDLTKRQREVAELLRLDSKGIAEATGMSLKSVEMHISSIYTRTGISGRAAVYSHIKAELLLGLLDEVEPNLRKVCHQSLLEPLTRMREELSLMLSDQ